MTKKIILVGLNSAGKTSIYQNTFFGSSIDELRELKPTRGVQRYSHEVEGETLIIWDFGGQEVYRSDYLQNRSLFLDTDVMIYVIDVQDEERFEESIDYFKDIVSIFPALSLQPKIFLLFHKIDNMTKFRSSLMKANAMVKSKIENTNLNILNYSTSVASNLTLVAFSKILSNIIPNYTAINQNKINSQIFIDPEHQKIDAPLTSHLMTEVAISDEEPVDLEKEADKIVEEVVKEKRTIADKFESNSLLKFQQQLSKLKGEEIGKQAKIGIIENFTSYISQYMIELINLRHDDDITEYDTKQFASFVEKLPTMRSEIWNFMQEQKISEFQIKQKVPILLLSFIRKMLDSATLNGSISNVQKAGLLATVNVLVYPPNLTSTT
ncbi:MAG: hypothetical protein INQ03_15610 [Candidatus Heimdallarchaeota archaeon]|nr:hypothetical protein [Candidatus Heimdallarchaeota archaeon]